MEALFRVIPIQFLEKGEWASSNFLRAVQIALAIDPPEARGENWMELTRSLPQKIGLGSSWKASLCKLIYESEWSVSHVIEVKLLQYVQTPFISD